MDFSWGNLDKCGDGAAHIEQSVHLHRRLAGSKTRPREHGQAKVDGGGIEGVEGTVGDRNPTVRRRTADERLGSASVRSRRRCASGARGWRPPGWSARLCREIRRGRVWAGPHASRLQYRANFRDRLVAQRPGRETDPNRRSRANDDRRDSARRTCEIHRRGDDPSTVRRRCGRSSCSIVGSQSRQNDLRVFKSINMTIGPKVLLSRQLRGMAKALAGHY